MKGQPLLLLGLLLILAACQRAASRPSPTQTDLPLTATQPVPTLTRPAAPSTPTPGERTQEAVSLAARVAKQTATEAWIATMVSQTEIASQEAANASNFLTSTAIVQAIQATVTPRTFQSFRSPDGKWLAEVILYDCAQIVPGDSYDSYTSSYEILRVSSRTVETQLLACGGMGAAGLGGLFWTADSRFFYYTNAREGVPDGGYPWRPPISRFDVTTGKSEVLGGAEYSPDKQRIAGVDGADLVIWEVDSDAVIRFPGPPPDQGYIQWFSWSLDGRSLVYLTESSCCDTSILIRVDLDTRSQTRLLGEQDPPMIEVDWRQPGVLYLFSFGPPPTHYIYDLTSGLLSPISETTPTAGTGETPTPVLLTATPVPTYPPDPAFPANVYPPEKPFNQPYPGDGFEIMGHGCPNLTGVRPGSEPAVETVQPVLEAVRTGDVYKIRQNSDVTYWPVTGLGLRRQYSALNPGFITIQPAARSPLANLLARLCGEEALRVSWWAQVNSNDGNSDYFLLQRKGRWLVWISSYDYGLFQV